MEWVHHKVNGTKFKIQFPIESPLEAFNLDEKSFIRPFILLEKG
jgi:hypothetical protein